MVLVGGDLEVSHTKKDSESSILSKQRVTREKILPGEDEWDETNRTKFNKVSRLKTTFNGI